MYAMVTNHGLLLLLFKYDLNYLTHVVQVNTVVDPWGEALRVIKVEHAFSWVKSVSKSTTCTVERVPVREYGQGKLAESAE